MLWRRVRGAVLILDVNDGDPIALSGSGAELWELLEEPTTASGACAVLSCAGEADRAVVNADIERVLQELEERGLVERVH